jgi:hypothetical protein
LLALPDIIISDQDARAAPRSGDYVDEIIADALACFDAGELMFTTTSPISTSQAGRQPRWT